MAAVSAEGSTVWVLIRRLNSSWSRSIALVVRALFHWLTGNRVKVSCLAAAISAAAIESQLVVQTLPNGRAAPSASPTVREHRRSSRLAGCRRNLETRHPVEVGADEEAHLVQWL